jgi:hypothetical protein
MVRLSTILAAAIFAFGLASGASAQTTDTTAGSTTISEQGGIKTTGEVIFQDILITPDVTPPPVVPSSGSANVTVTGAGGDAVSLAVPQRFEVVSTDTGKIVTVVTTAKGQYAAISGLQTLLSAGGTLSVDVAGAINMSDADLQAGEYEGLLVVVAQYN